MTRPDNELFEFGSFRVDLAERLLLRDGERVPLEPKVFETLLVLIRHGGRLVGKDQLIQTVWPDRVVEESNLTRNISVLRKTLHRSDGGPQYIETVPKCGYRFVGEVHALSSQQTEVIVQRALRDSGGPVTEAWRRHPAARWWLVSAAACLAFGLVLALKSYDSSLRQPPWKLVRLTADPGISDEPALSPDGRLVAYSSDPSVVADRNLVAGGLDLYVRHVEGGSPIRLTFDGAGNRMPDFSPDGSWIVFRSNRDGGGIYEMPALGGDVRLIARGGFNPRFSPDGTQVAYWVGSQSVAAAVPGSGSVWVVPVGGGQPQRVGPNFTTARFPIWHKDGKRLLMTGYTSARAFDRSSIDWWIVPIDGSKATRTGAYEALVHAGMQLTGSATIVPVVIPEPRCWSSLGDKVTFSMPDGDSVNLWEIELSPRSGTVVGSPQRLTTGAGSDSSAGCASGDAVAFSTVETRQDIWLLPFDLDGGTPAGPPEGIGQGPLWHDSSSLARDGRFIAFASDRSGRGNIWIREIETGKELPVAASPFVQAYAVSNASGGKIAFSVFEKDKRVLYVSEPGGAPETVCDGCLRATDWSRDEKSLLVFGGDPYQISILDIATHRQIPLVTHPDYPVLYGRFSPDNRWISFTARVQRGRGRIVIASADGPKPIPESAWLTIAEVEPDDYANWSPDGKTLYFTSSRDGYSCLWGQRIDASSSRLVGEAFAVQHFHGRVSFEHGGWSAAAGRIAIPLVEKTGNLWMMSRSGTP
jgi:Tol biopolymer transport system component/DNA-binding winged helix-turn-helix (wHTH) protein